MCSGTELKARHTLGLRDDRKRSCRVLKSLTNVQELEFAPLTHCIDLFYRTRLWSQSLITFRTMDSCSSQQPESMHFSSRHWPDRRRSLWMASSFMYTLFFQLILSSYITVRVWEWILVSHTTQHVRIHVQKPGRVMLGVFFFFITLHTYFTFLLLYIIHSLNLHSLASYQREKIFWAKKKKYFNVILLVWDLVVAFGKMACSGLNHLVVLMIDVEFCCERALH